MTIAEWVGLLGVLPFVALLAVTVSNVWKVCAWMRRTADPRHYSIPLAMVVLSRVWSTPASRIGFLPWVIISACFFGSLHLYLRILSLTLLWSQ